MAPCPPPLVALLSTVTESVCMKFYLLVERTLRVPPETERFLVSDGLRYARRIAVQNLSFCYVTEIEKFSDEKREDANKALIWSQGPQNSTRGPFRLISEVPKPTFPLHCLVSPRRQQVIPSIPFLEFNSACASCTAV